MTVQMTSSNEFEKVEVFNSVQRRRRWTIAKKLQMMEESELPGMSFSFVARKYGISSSLLFTWRSLTREGKLSAIRAGKREETRLIFVK
jgi:transposase